jgi:hypothetical protein
VSCLFYVLVKKPKVVHKQGHKHHYDLAAVFDKHIECEFEHHDVEATMKTMVREPYVHHVPMLTGVSDMMRFITFTKITSLGRCLMI